MNHTDRWTDADIARLPTRGGARVLGDGIHATLVREPPPPLMPPDVVIGDNAWSLMLPWPPSLNHYYVPVAKGRQVLSQAGRDYHQRVAYAVAVARRGRPPLTGRLSLQAELHGPSIYDCDNFAFKALQDALEHARVYEHDTQLDHIQSWRGSISTPGYVAVLVAHVRPRSPQ